MFYSSEILTSRKYGVAVVWIVATLGHKSAFKRINRKAIADVDVPKACDTILSPDAPLALRLQSNLLYGITRVYAQQCGYVLADAESAKDKMLAIYGKQSLDDWTRRGGGSEHRGKPEHMLLSEDPNCDLALTFHDAIDFHLGHIHDPDASQLSPTGSHSWRKPSQEMEIAPIQVPSPVRSSPIPSDQRRGTHWGADRSSSAQVALPGFYEDDLGFGIDADGNLIMEDAVDTLASFGTPPGTPVREIHPIRATPNARPVTHVLPAGPSSIDNGHHERDMSLPSLAPPTHNEQDGSLYHQNASTPASLSSIQVETAVATIRPRSRPRPRILQTDASTELRSRDLARWSADYASSMQEELRKRDIRREAMYAKINAQHWVLGHGYEWSRREDGPLFMFSGAYWHNHVLHGNTTISSNASTHSDEPLPTLGFEAEMERLRGHDQTTMDLEIGREAPSPLDDRRGSSLLPWSQIRSSSVRSLGLGGLHTAAHSWSDGTRPAWPASRHGSRISSRSPMLRPSMLFDGYILSSEGPGLTALQPDTHVDMTDGDGDIDMLDFAVGEPDRPLVNVNSDSLDFLAFVEAGIASANEGQHEHLLDNSNEVCFADLLPTSGTNRMVAAHAFMHVLSLATRTLLKVAQQHHLGDIVLMRK